MSADPRAGTRRRARSFPLQVAMLGLAVTGPAPAAADLLIVLNKSDHEAALVDPATLAVVAKLPTGRGPHEVATLPFDAGARGDGGHAYVSNYGFYAIFTEGERPRMEAGNSITVIDLARRAVVDTFDLGARSQPHGIVLSRDGRLLWVTCEGARLVVELDAATGRVLREWHTDQDVSHMVVPTRDETKLYVSNIRSGSVTVIDRRDDRVVSIPTGAGAEGIDVSPDGREVWVTNRGANNLSVLSVAGDSVVATIDSHGEMPIRVKFTPDGRQALVSNARSNAVAVFDAKARSLLGTIAVGAMPVGIQMAPDGRRAFVANTNDHKVTVIDVAGRKVVKTFGTGNEPDGMAWARGAAAR